MHDALTRLCARAGRYEGQGLNHRKQTFQATLNLTVIAKRRGITVDYRAQAEDSTLFHQEHTIIGLDSENNLCLWPIMSQLPHVLPHPLRRDRETDDGLRSIVFGCGETNDDTTFRQELTFDLWPGGDLGYRHAWGVPGHRFKTRSSCRLQSITESATIPG